MNRLTTPLLTALTAGLASAGTASAATIFHDTFTDLGRTNGADATDIAWYQANGVTLSAATGQLVANVAEATNFNRFVGVFGGTTILTGETLQLSFDMRFTSAPSNVGGWVRVGIYNNGGTAITADAQSSTTNNDYGYGFATNPGLVSTTGTTVNSETAGDQILSGTPSFAAVSGNTPGASIDWGTTTHSVVYSITRLANGTLALSASIDGGTAATGNIAAINSNYTFNEIAFGQGANPTKDYVIDNVKLEVIPEPASLALLGLGGLLIGRRKRRA